MADYKIEVVYKKSNRLQSTECTCIGRIASYRKALPGRVNVLMNLVQEVVLREPYVR